MKPYIPYIQIIVRELNDMSIEELCICICILILFFLTFVSHKPVLKD